MLSARILFSSFLLAFSGIITEFLWAHLLTLIYGNTLLHYNLVVGIYIASMGLGALFCTEKFKHNSLALLIDLEIILAFISAAGPLLIIYFQINSLAIYLPIIIMGFIVGFEIPLLTYISEKKLFYGILALDYFGILAGSVLFATVLLPYFGLFNLAIICAIINLAVPFIIYTNLFKKNIGLVRLSILALLVIACIYLLITNSQWEAVVKEKYVQ